MVEPRRGPANCCAEQGVKPTPICVRIATFPSMLQSSNRSPERGARKARHARKDNDGEHADDGDGEVQDHVVFLTDKCNALARRLQQVEEQLFRERADGKKLLYDAASASSSKTAGSSQNINSSSSSYRSNSNFGSASPEQHPHSPASRADARLSPSNSGGHSRASSSSQALRSPAARSGGRAGGGGNSNTVDTGTQRHVGVHIWPATAGTTTTSSVVNNNRGHLSPTKVKAQTQQQQQHLRSPGVPSGIMVPPEVWKPIKEGRKPQRNGSGKMDGDALHCEIVEQEIADRFDVVTGGIEQLENVFSGAAQILENRVRAITAISRYLCVVPSIRVRVKYLFGRRNVPFLRRFPYSSVGQRAV